MKTLFSALLLSMTFAGSAYAAGPAPSGELDYPPATASGPSLTRAQVIEELRVARANGQVTFGELDQPAAQVHTAALTREQVRAEAAQARANGDIAFGELDYQGNRS